MRRLVVAAALVLCAAGCKKKPSESKQYAADIADLCQSFARSGARQGDFTAAVAWVEKRTRTQRFREQMTQMAGMAPGDKVNALKAAVIEAGLESCPFLDGWNQGLSRREVEGGLPEDADRCVQARALYLRHVAKKSAEAVEAAVETDRPHLEAQALENQERVKISFLDACHALGEFDLACFDFDDPTSSEPSCKSLLTRLAEALASAPKTP